MIGAPLLLGIGSTVLEDAERTRFETLRPAGYVLLERNLGSPRQVRALTDALRSIDPGLDPIVALDAEHLSALGASLPPIPGAAELGAEGKPARIAEVGACTGRLLALLGINLSLGPVLDVGGNDGRRWHPDPQRVIDHAGTWNRWLRRQKIRAAAGTFPAGGHPEPSQAGLTDLLSEAVIPYTALMTELDGVIVEHRCFDAIDPGVPASQSRRIITSFLRDQLGFDRHLVLTGDLGGSDTAVSATRAIMAGADLVMLAGNPSRAEEAADAIRGLPVHHTDDADRRIERFRKKLAAPPLWSDRDWEKTCGRLERA